MVNQSGQQTERRTYIKRDGNRWRVVVFGDRGGFSEFRRSRVQAEARARAWAQASDCDYLGEVAA